MSNLTQFMSKQNTNLLWEVLLDELHINQTNKSLMSNVRMVFDSNISPFTSKINPKANLMELNKEFLRQVVLAVNRLFPREQNIKRITITDEEVTEPYRIEDIQASRQNNFEKEFERKRLELENYMTLKKPKELDFSDNTSDGKIVSMDSLVAEKMAQRNLEIEQFQNSNYNTSNINPEKWLSPKETSVKGEKNVIQGFDNNDNNDNINNNKRLKHINIDNNNNISLIKEKKVTWNDLESTSNIFQKLKKKSEEQSVVELIDESIEQKQYIEQQSVPLPEVKQEQIIRTNPTNNVIQNTPIIPQNEIVKQINEMNAKIENLYDMINKLTKIMESKMVPPSTDIQKTDIQKTDIH